jgi:hypothetical protein
VNDPLSDTSGYTSIVIALLYLATAAPVPSPAAPVDDGLPTSTLLVGLMLPLILAIFGLAGVLLAAIISARSAVRMKLIDASNETSREKRAYSIRTTKAIHNVLIAAERLMIAVTETQRNPGSPPPANAADLIADVSEEAKRVRASDADWRATYAEGGLLATAEMYQGILDFDRDRGAFMEAVNAADWSAAKAAVVALKKSSNSVFFAVQRDKVQSVVNLSRLLYTRRLRSALIKQERDAETHLAVFEKVIKATTPRVK